jgi:hypothetical protein
VPGAENVEDVVDAPIVAVNGNQILVDGHLTGSTRAVEELGRPQKLDELFSLLVNTRTLWSKVQPNRPFHGICILQIDEQQSAVVVKSVFQTATLAGYKNISFLVRRVR